MFLCSIRVLHALSFNEVNLLSIDVMNFNLFHKLDDQAVRLLRNVLFMFLNLCFNFLSLTGHFYFRFPVHPNDGFLVESIGDNGHFLHSVIRTEVYS